MKAVRLYFGAVLVAGVVMLAAWGGYEIRDDSAPLADVKVSERNDAVVPLRSKRSSEQKAESEVSRKVGEVSEGSEKGAGVRAGGEADSESMLPAVRGAVAGKNKTPAPDVVHDRGNQLQLLADEDLRAAFAAVYREPAGPVREEMLGRFAFTFAKSLPAEAAAIVDNDMVAGIERDEAAIAVVHQWALNDLVGAQAWAKTFPEGPLKARALKEIAGVTDYVEAMLRQRTDG